MTAGAAAKWVWFLPSMACSSEGDHTWAVWQERWGQTPEEAFTTRAPVPQFIQRLSTRASELWGKLNLPGQASRVGHPGSIDLTADLGIIT